MGQTADIKGLAGKRISYYDGFSGFSQTFKIGRVEFDAESNGYKVYGKNPDKDFIFIKAEYFKALTEDGKYTCNGSIDGCAFRETFTIQG